MKIMNEGLQIHLLKEYFKKNGYKNNLDKIDFDKFFDSTFPYYENLLNMIGIVDRLSIERDGEPWKYISKTVAPNEEAEAIKEHKLLVFTQKLRDEFNNNEGLELEEEEFDCLLSKCDDLLEDLEIIPNLEGNDEAPNTKPPRDHSTIIKEISNILKRKPKPRPPSFNVDGISLGGSLSDVITMEINDNVSSEAGVKTMECNDSASSEGISDVKKMEYNENVMPNIYAGIRLVINDNVGLIVRLIVNNINDSGTVYLLHKCDLKTNLETYIMALPRNFLELKAHEKIFKQISKNMFDIDDSLIDRLYNKFREVVTTDAYYAESPFFEINELDSNSDLSSLRLPNMEIKRITDTNGKIPSFDGGNGGTAIPEQNLKEAIKMHDEMFSRRLTVNLPEEHFISQYLKYATDITDAYKEYQFCIALWLLSAVTQDKFMLKLKQKKIKPNLWFFILGKSTTSHKSTVIDKAKEVFEEVSETKIFNEDYSLEGYLQILANNPIGNFIRDEALELMKKYHRKNNDGIFEAECAIYDGQSRRKTLWGKSKDNKPQVYEVNNPFVTKFYGTTPDNFSRYMTIDDFLTGFGFRFLISHPQYKKPNRMGLALETKKDVDAKVIVSQRLKKLHQDIKKMSAVDFNVTDEAMEYFNKVVQETENKIDDMNNSMLNSAFGRSQEHILKMAMLLEIGKPLKQDSNEISHLIDIDTMKISCELVINYFLPTMLDTVNNLQNASNRNSINRIIQTLRRLGGIAPHSALLHDTKLKSKEFNECIQTMLESNALKQFINDTTKTKHYRLLATNEMPTINI